MPQSNDGYCRKIKEVDQEPLKGLRFQCGLYADHGGWGRQNFEDWTFSWEHKPDEKRD